MSQALGLSQHLTKTLLNPNQMRANRVIVDSCPRQFDSTSTHSIFFATENVRIPLLLDGIISYIPTQLPSLKELEECNWLSLTSEEEWRPYSDDFIQAEAETNKESEIPFERDAKSRLILAFTTFDTRHCEISQVLSGVSSTLVEDTLIEALEATVMVRNLGATSSTKPRGGIEPAELARRWGIGLESAKQTLKVTTQKGLRSAVHPIHRRYKTKQQQLRYNQLACKFYSDTMFCSTKSTRGNVCGQVFCNDTDFTRFYPMRTKGDAGNALKMFVQDVGIPSAMHTDGAREETVGVWGKTIKDLGIRQTTTEPYSAWQNRAESSIKELKKAVPRTIN